MKRTLTITAVIAILALAFTAVFADTDLDAALNVEGGSLTFGTTQQYPWQVCEIDGRLCARSGNAGISNSSSSVSIGAYLGEGQSLVFDWNVDSEATQSVIAMWDYIAFKVNGEYIDYIHSVEENTPLGWQHYEWQVQEAGNYTFEWVYVKDASNDQGADCGYLDNVEVVGEIILPPTPTPEPQPGEEFVILEENFDISPEDWWNDDFDGDGRFWEYDTTVGHNAAGAICSYSYANWGGPLTPDNQACTPEFDIPEDISECSLSFWLYSLDDEFYAEHIDVWIVAIEDNFYGGYDLIMIDQLDSITMADGDGWHEYTYDLTEYAGYEQINIAFIHNESTDQYGIALDDVVISATMGGAYTATGDVDGDGRVSVTDAVLAMRYSMGLITLTDVQQSAGDIDGDGRVTVADALKIMRISMNLDS